MTPQRLLLVSQDLGIGGLERVVATLATTVDRARFSPLALCLRESGAFGDAIAAEGIPVHVLPWQAGRPDYLAFRRIACFLRNQRIDVLHTHNTDAFLSAGIGRLLANRRITHVHTDHARDFPDRWRYMAAEHVLARFAYRVVGVSEHTTENLARYERIPRRKLVTIPNGIDARPFAGTPDIAQLRRRLGLRLDQPVIGLAARITAQKGVDVLVRAIPALRAAHPDLSVVVAGEGPDIPALEQLAESLHVRDAVRFVGPRLDFVELLPALDAYVMPSRWEGLPMALLEAMAARRAIVATAVGGIPTAVADGRSALLVPPEDPARLADALARVLRDRSLAAALGAAARERFDAAYSAEIMTRRYERLYAREDVA
jgi:glycosyltransferase involved in cell wall biosynthesis